jgi:hypothetical protein
MSIKTLIAGLALAGVALSTVPASAQTAKLELRKGETVATLVNPLKRPFDDALDGRMWHCEGVSCRAPALSTASGTSLARECATAAAKLGAFAQYQTGDKVVEGDALAACNAKAKKS